MENFDNVEKIVGEDLKKEISAGSKVAVAAACFSIYAFQELKEELAKIGSFKFVYNGNFAGEDEFRQKLAETLLGDKFEGALRNNLSQSALAQECAAWVKSKAQFKVNVSGKTIPSLLNVVGRDENAGVAYKGVNNFSLGSLGYGQSDDLFVDIDKFQGEETKKFLRQFDQVWNREDFSGDVTRIVLEYLEAATRNNAPEFLYFVALYSVLRNYLADPDRKSVKVSSVLKNTVIWQKLFLFQKHAVLSIVEKLDQHNGCILADSVGLGKTFTALAVVKYFELCKQKVLVLCPKKLSDNWKTYNKYADKSNILMKDDLHYLVMHHTDMNRDEGKSTGDFEDLSKIDWGSFDLVVIDESHNFRSGSKDVLLPNWDELPPEDIVGWRHDNYLDEDVPILSEEAEKRYHKLYWNRYDFLVNKVIKEGRKTKVLMLSATPLNNEFKDLRNQIMLAYEGDYSVSKEEKQDKMSHVSYLLRQAQEVFNNWGELEPQERTVDVLLSNLGEDFLNLLTDVTIARSRKEIVDSYGTKEIGVFPERLKPVNIYAQIGGSDGLLTFEKLYQDVISLNLGIYSPSLFLKQSSAVETIKIKKQLDAMREGREVGIKKMMSINFLKRIESCIYSFVQTITRLRDKLDVVLSKIEEYEKNQQEKKVVPGWDPDWENDDDLAGYINILRNPIDLSQMDYLKWKEFLREDRDALNKIIGEIGDVSPKMDDKLQKLKKIITDKLNQPVNEGNKKILIFTAFADTAEYLYENLKEELLGQGLHTALVTGKGVKTTLPINKAEFNKVLTLFAPKAKNKDKIYGNIKGEIDVLIGTDCISEGQNLQDCDMVVNYDIHWNPVRIIQRFGRIDRIGSTNGKIQMVNFWPEMNLNKYLQLQARVENRMKALTAVSSPDDNPLSDEQIKDINYRTVQLKKMKEVIIDLDDGGSGASMSNFIQKKEKYKHALEEYLEWHAEVKEAPVGLGAVVPGVNDASPKGVIFLLRNLKMKQGANQYNPCYPCYLVYVKDDGEIFQDYGNAYMTLHTLRLMCENMDEPDEELYAAFAAETNNGRNMGHYRELLARAVASILEKDEENEKQKFICGNGDAFAEKSVWGVDDFEVVCYFVVR